MLKQIELTNFRRHESLSLAFSQGMSVIRAPNEGGKSSLIESCAYALYGSKALRSTFDEAVTWGKPPTTLKVVLTLEHGGRTYTFTRSKAGAEVTENGNVFVTGQNEVSAFAARLLGADANLASKLMLANQNNLRGSLEQGPKAAAELIEELADFNLFTRLLDAAQNTLMLGSPAVLETNLAHARAQLDAYVAPEPVDVEGANLEITNLSLKLESLPARIADARIKSDAASAEKDAKQAVYAKAKAIDKELERIHHSLLAQEKLRDEITPTANQFVDEARMKVLADALSDMEDHAKRYAAWLTFSELKTPEIYWEGDAASLDQEINKVQKEISELKSRLAEEEKRIAVSESMLVTTSACGFCGQDVSQFPGVAEKNAKIQGAIASARAHIRQIKEDLEQECYYLNNLEGTRRGGVRVNTEINPLRQYLQVNDSSVPPVVKWAGGEPAVPGDTDSLKAEMEALRTLQRLVERAQGKFSLITSGIIRLKEEWKAQEALRDATGHITEEELADVVRRADDATYQRLLLETERDQADAGIKVCKERLNAALQRQADAEALRERLQGEVTRCEGQLADLHFNNALIKKIRAARPIIGDKLWNTTLATVSTFFSTMRGEKSLVQRDKEGFKVNGQSIASLSGSTLDLLGLAIRIALVRTFLPTCTFLVLDEPAAASDADRTAAMAGFIKSCGFGQVLLVTHEDVSESLADNLIEL